MAWADGIDLASLSAADALMKLKGLRRKLLERGDLRPVRIAVLGGSTTMEVVGLWELWLLESGFRPEFYQAEYGRFYVEAVHDAEALIAFRPELVYVHTSVYDIERFPGVGASEAEFEERVRGEVKRFEQVWTSLVEKTGCVVIQNNFELPQCAVLGNLDVVATGGQTRFVMALNAEFARTAVGNPRLVVQDVCSISARLGLAQWFDARRWFSYKIVTTPEGSRALAISLAALVRAIYGRARKVLVLDLDNTIWGGVIGDDGVEKIQIGKETAVAEAYTAFQRYCLSLRNRGVLLAVCSKNDEEVARQGFEHPDSVLKLEHISCFKANWEPKHDNIARIAEELNLGVESFVFVDDNAAERALVEGQVPGIAVPDIGSDVMQYAAILEAGRYFEQVSLSEEDLGRAALYKENAQRAEFEQRFADYGEYLDSLEMTAEIARFRPIYLDRIVQLTNKTNQFNLTGRRYTQAEMETAMKDAGSIGMYGRLSDRFGDNGLVSIVLGHRKGAVLEIDLWLMSCRVLKREMEIAMLDALVEEARKEGAATLRGIYVPTKKNAMVKDHYARLGFELVEERSDGGAAYILEVGKYVARNRHIRIVGQ